MRGERPLVLMSPATQPPPRNKTTDGAGILAVGICAQLIQPRTWEDEVGHLGRLWQR